MKETIAMKEGVATVDELTKFMKRPIRLDLYDILRAEHQLIDDAFNEWILTLEDDRLRDGLWYLEGVHEMADRLVQLLEPKEEEGNADES